MAVVVDSEVPSHIGFSASGLSSLDYSFNNVGGALLVCGISLGGSGGPINSVTYNSVSLGSPDISQVYGSSGAMSVLYHLLSPATGAHTMHIGLPSAIGAIISGCISFTGADSVTPIGQTGSAKNDTGGGSTNPNVTLPGTGTDNYIVDTANWGTGGGESSGQTISWFKDVDNGSAGSNGGGSRAQGNGSGVTMQYTLGSSDWWGMVAVEIVAQAPDPWVGTGSFSTWQ